MIIKFILFICDCEAIFAEFTANIIMVIAMIKLNWTGCFAMCPPRKSESRCIKFSKCQLKISLPKIGLWLMWLNMCTCKLNSQIQLSNFKLEILLFVLFR